MPVEASWTGNGGLKVTQSAETLLVSRNGAVVRLAEKLFAGQEITLRRQREGDSWKIARARIVAEIDQGPEGFLYAIAIVDPRADFWDIDFPAPHKAQEALARLLMECSFCQRREVVYLNEPELKSFEIRKCVARVCPHCDSPSIWIEAQPEVAPVIPDLPDGSGRSCRSTTKSHAGQGARLGVYPPPGISGRSGRLRGFVEGRHQFRSRNQYPEGTRVEVAVPFTPGSAAIFVPIRIVSSQAIPAAGLFRHGAAYVRPPLDSGA